MAATVAFGLAPGAADALAPAMPLPVVAPWSMLLWSVLLWPLVPELPDVPELPELPELPDVPELPEVPEPDWS
jgi:hypothetical protein